MVERLSEIRPPQRVECAGADRVGELRDDGIAEVVIVPVSVGIVEIHPVVRLRFCVVEYVVRGELHDGGDVPRQLPLGIGALAGVHRHDGAVPLPLRVPVEDKPSRAVGVRDVLRVEPADTVLVPAEPDVPPVCEKREIVPGDGPAQRSLEIPDVERPEPVEARVERLARTIRVREIIADVCAEAPGELPSPFARRDVDDPVHRLAVFGIVRAGDELHLFDEALVHLHDLGRIERIGDGDAVDPVGDPSRPAAAQVESSACVDGDAGLEVEDLSHFGHRECRNLAPVDCRRGRRLVFLNERPFGNRHDLLADLHDSGRNLEIDRRRLVEGDLDVRDRLLVIADAGNHERIRPRLDVQNHVVAVDVRRRTHRRSLDLDAGADDRFTRLTILDLPRNFPRVPRWRLCDDGHHQDRQKQ